MVIKVHFNSNKSGKHKKVHNFFAPPPPDYLNFSEFGKIRNFMNPTPLGPNLRKILDWGNFQFWEPSLGKKKLVKTLKIAYKSIQN